MKVVRGLFAVVVFWGFFALLVIRPVWMLLGLAGLGAIGLSVYIFVNAAD